MNGVASLNTIKLESKVFQFFYIGMETTHDNYIKMNSILSAILEQSALKLNEIKLKFALPLPGSINFQIFTRTSFLLKHKLWSFIKLQQIVI